MDKPQARVDIQPTMWLVQLMKTLGIFEAKTKFAALCEEVARTGLPTLVQKRGRPLVLVTPPPIGLKSERPDIIASLNDWNQSHGRERGDFPPVWELRGGNTRNPLED
jgi:antitoxin (DNA-binding transcriptional repressor) of toxin-antitoxin stability system